MSKIVSKTQNDYERLKNEMNVMKEKLRLNEAELKDTKSVLSDKSKQIDIMQTELNRTKQILGTTQQQLKKLREMYLINLAEMMNIRNDINAMKRDNDSYFEGGSVDTNDDSNDDDSNDDDSNDDDSDGSYSDDDECPGHCDTFTIDGKNDEYIVTGFIRENMVIPNGIVKMIYTYYNEKAIEFRILDENGELTNDCERFTMNVNKDCSFNVIRNHFEEEYGEVRLHIPFYCGKSIYPVYSMQYREFKEFTINPNDIEKHNINDDYLIEIPHDYLTIIINDMENAVNRCLSTIVIELKQDKIWKKQENMYNDPNWKNNLSVGDFIGVKYMSKWYESVIRHKQDNIVYIHWTGWDLKWNEIIDINGDNPRITKRSLSVPYPKRITFWRYNGVYFEPTLH